MTSEGPQLQIRALPERAGYLNNSNAFKKENITSLFICTVPSSIHKHPRIDSIIDVRIFHHAPEKFKISPAAIEDWLRGIHMQKLMSKVFFLHSASGDEAEEFAADPTIEPDSDVPSADQSNDASREEQELLANIPTGTKFMPKGPAKYGPNSRHVNLVTVSKCDKVNLLLSFSLSNSTLNKHEQRL